MKALREQNIVHRDLKPANILIKKDQINGKMTVCVCVCVCVGEVCVSKVCVNLQIRLADFGLARLFVEEATKKPVTMNTFAGTPVFMVRQQ